MSRVPLTRQERNTYENCFVFMKKCIIVLSNYFLLKSGISLLKLFFFFIFSAI